MASGNPSWAPRAISLQKKKNLGRGTKKTKRACEKGLRGGRRIAPSPYKKALDAMRPRVPVTLWLTNKPSKTQKRRGPTLRARRRSPGPHSGAGRVRRPDVMPFSAQKAYTGLPTSARKPTRASRKSVRPQNRTKRGKTKQDKRSNETPLPPRVREKGLRGVPGESQKRPGPRMAPRQNTRKKGRTAKTGEQTECGGDTNKKKTKNTKCVWGCAL